MMKESEKIGKQTPSGIMVNRSDQSAHESNVVVENK